MGDFLEKIKKRQESPVAIAHRIALHLSSSVQNALIVEGGEDVFFYSSVCQRLRPIVRPDFFVANGRAGVLGVLDVAKALGKLDRCYGIVDRDFHFDEGEFLADGHCFVLGVYSFENLFSKKETLIDIGRAIFALESSTPYLARWTVIVDNVLSSLPTLLLRKHACAYWCRSNKIVCNLENFNPSMCVIHNGFGVLTLKEHTYESFLADTHAVIPADKQCELDSALMLLKGKHWSMAFRGHYLWRLIVRVLNDFREWLDDQLSLAKRSRSRTRAEIQDRHALEACCSFVDVPEELTIFLANVGVVSAAASL